MQHTQELAPNLKFQKVMPLLDGDVAKFKMAISSEKIKDCNYMKVKQSVRKIMLMLGITSSVIDSMEEIEKQVLLDFITNEYGNHTTSEFELAFTKAIKRELEIDDPRHFNNFSCEYVGRIMSAYRKWAAKTYKELPKTEIVQQLPPPAFNKLDLVQTFYDEYLRSQTTVKFISDRVYDILEEEKCLMFTDEEIDSIRNNAKEAVLHELSETIKMGSIVNRDGYKSAIRNKNLIEELGKEFYKAAIVEKKIKVYTVLAFFAEMKNEGVENIVEHFKNEE